MPLSRRGRALEKEPNGAARPSKQNGGAASERSPPPDRPCAGRDSPPPATVFYSPKLMRRRRDEDTANLDRLIRPVNCPAAGWFAMDLAIANPSWARCIIHRARPL